MLLLTGVSVRSQDTASGFVLVPAGYYMIGKAQHAVNPRRKVHVDSFYIAR